MKAKKFEQQFDKGVDLTASLDLTKARRVLQAQKRVNVDFPTWMVDSLDREAANSGLRGSRLLKSGWLSGWRRPLRTWRSNGRARVPPNAEHQVSDPVGPARTPSRKNSILSSWICMDIFEVT